MGYKDYEKYLESYEEEEVDSAKKCGCEDEEKNKKDCYKRNYPTGAALEEAYRAGRKDGYKEGYCEGYDKGSKDGCKQIKEKIAGCIDKIECC
ncbi:hypothetical protein CBE01nite_22540 [Clostridium beijerinckii]|uniref:Flagellar assembly protein H n=1 Tax=Clostridium beijerinckii TaxID=1520 RepID=A0AB74VAM2_CLOBE|nr:hypothetical protein [Clostridium beijerinckii]NRZ27675.1 flagellar biosynthesis/type III secretory pathway protein FliH [Clostridium beijerinckii]NYB96539.1 flagellar biosynthesis/type III secretory pathway protein FliH [Clostridium beijerinckii]OOM25067.1 hypothetical protein CLBEI_17510 [Clostridium beijerinckii]QUN33476.1 hypothetical protein KEC93_16040 [Clostridium beijerinckii]SQB01260.1 Uncharacterised protein [Clostridium beijerinckii]